MKPTKLIKTAGAFARARLLKQKTPLVTGWAITYRCNRRCAYCGLWRDPGPELDTTQVLKIVDTLADMGCVRISFTGGEPLLRPDMGEIVDYVHARGLETKMNSNGRLVKERIHELGSLDMMNLSLEGPEDVHDAIRGPGSFAEVMEAAQTARDHGIAINLATVLNRLNLDALDFILETARQWGGKVMFQPATQTMLGGEQPNDLAPDVDAQRAAIRLLIDRKSKGDKTIANSVPGLKHLLKWPRSVPMTCASGQISCRIEPDGKVVYCSREPKGYSPLNCTEVSFAQAFDNLGPMTCNDCWCAARAELNLAFSCKAPVLLNQIKSLVR